MIEKIITEGSKVELQRLASISHNQRTNAEQTEVKTYYSLVAEVLDEDRIKITMPLDKGKVVPLGLNSRYNACFYTSNGLYQGRVTVIDRYKEENIYMMVVELTSELTKFQRRQYYRLGCTMDIVYKKMEESEEVEFSKEGNDLSVSKKDYIEGIALDISGGGMRFVSDEKLKQQDHIFVIIEIQYETETKKYGLNASVISSEQLTNRTDKYEHRVEYTNMNGRVREDLIKYIFDAERKQRKKEFDSM